MSVNKTKGGAFYKLKRNEEFGEYWMIEKDSKKYCYDKLTLQYYLISGYPRDVVDFIINNLPEPIPKNSIYTW